VKDHLSFLGRTISGLLRTSRSAAETAVRALPETPYCTPFFVANRSSLLPLGLVATSR